MSDPLISVIIPLYNSDETLDRCLASLDHQTFRNFEVVLVDSSPDDRSAAVCRTHAVDALYVHTDHRLLPQAARNCGAQYAHGRLLAFTDPDIYPAPDWLARLARAATARHAVVVGSIACFGRGWLARGAHLCKFNICLPAGEARSAPLGWSGNILVERGIFDSLGGWDEDYTQGDTAFTSRVRSTGGDLWFEPRAVVEHDHGPLRFLDFVRERYRRGFEFAEMEEAGRIAARPRASSLGELMRYPLRVPNRILFIGRAARQAGVLRDYFLTLPVIVAGVTAWYAGMWACHWRHWRRRGQQASGAGNAHVQ